MRRNTITACLVGLFLLISTSMAQSDVTGVSFDAQPQPKLTTMQVFDLVYNDMAAEYGPTFKDDLRADCLVGAGPLLDEMSSRLDAYNIEGIIQAEGLRVTWQQVGKCARVACALIIGIIVGGC